MKADNKTKPTSVSIADFLKTVDEQRRRESLVLIDMMRDISGCEPVMWGPSIIGFDTYHYVYETGREGDSGVIGFSPRKANLTVYFPDGFNDYADELARLGKHTTSVSCLYIKKLADIDLSVLHDLVSKSYAHTKKSNQISTVDAYIGSFNGETKKRLVTMRELVRSIAPEAEEKIGYAMPTYKLGGKNMLHFAGYAHHIGFYPTPETIAAFELELKGYTFAKGSVQFPHSEPLPTALVERMVRHRKTSMQKA